MALAMLADVDCRNCIMFGSVLLYLPIGGAFFALSQSNSAGKVIVLILFVGSILTWTVMVAKIRELSAAKRSSVRFIAAYRGEKHPLSLFAASQQYVGSPLDAVYEATCSALGSELGENGEADGRERIAQVRRLADGVMTCVRNVAVRTTADQSLILEENMGFLATATTTAPFLGLLGTVWGVMEAFGGMAMTGSAMLSDVAPGISGALLTTVVGLLVALPSAIGYNMLSDQIRRMCVMMDNFSQELIGDIERHYLHGA